MSLWAGFARRWLNLPPPRCRTACSVEWLSARDGVRLATVVERPLGATARTTVIARTAAPIDGPRNPVRAAARLLAEQGHAVVVQTCRGLHASEGRFHPFIDETSDGDDLIAWTARQPWFQRPLVLAGFGYGGNAAWAGLCGDTPVEGLIVGFAARDPYHWLHSDRALQLESALGIALALSAAETQPTRPTDLLRALRHRPLREADRVALRRVSWWREWLDHPRRDAYWQDRAPQPARLPGSALLIGAFGRTPLEAMLDDRAKLTASGSEPPGRVRLLLGPRAGNEGSRRARRRRETALRREAPRVILDFLDALHDGQARGSPVRAFVSGAERWCDLPAWPPADASECDFHLAGNGRAEADPEGALLREPVAEEQAPDRFVYDPADAGLSNLDFGTTLQRGDVLRYSSTPFESALEIAGTPRVVLFATSEAPRTDFFARLLVVSPADEATPISEGLARDALRDTASADPGPIEIELAPLWHRIAPGTRLRLEITSSGFPLYDRHPNTQDPPTRARDEDGVATIQQVWHDPQRPSRLRLPILSPL